MEDVIIIGAGVIGSFIARNFSRYQLKTVVLEKENDVCDVTSMANSAIVHSGYDPVPGTKKAYFNVKGNRMMEQVCKELDVDYENCGTLTVALYDEQLKMLDALLERSKQNGVPSKILTKEEVIELEPNINPEVKAALFCPTGGIVNPFTLTSHAMENAIDNGVTLHLSEEVLSITPKDGGFEVKTNKETYQTKIVVNAAGLASDKVASMVEPIDWKINPRKGQYHVLSPFDRKKPGKKFVNSVLFPLPSEKGKGILFSRTTSGNYIAGPSSEPVDDAEDVSTDSLTLANIKEQARSMVPNIPFGLQIRTYAGNRATPSTHDFIIEQSKTYRNFINVAGIESPGLVSSPAIGEYVVEELVKPLLNPEENKSYKKEIKKYLKPSKMSEEEKNHLIKKDPDYGQIVCNCELVTLGEIKDALNRSLPCNSIKALKKRTRAGFGPCQGGFCQPNIINILAKHFNVSPLEVCYDQEHSEIVLDEIKMEAK